MNTQDWALIIFTILTEMSVGSFLVLGIVHYFVAKKAGIEEADRMSDRILIAIIVTLGLGMLASLLHLGNPLDAPKAVNNIATSWLSREILAGVIFAVLGLVFVALQWFKVGSAALRSVIAVVTGLVGLFLIYAQANAYMLLNVPAWNNAATPISFFVTTFLLGVVAVGAALVINCAVVQKRNPDCADKQHELLRTAIRWLAIASVILLGIELVVMPLYVANLATGNAAAQASVGLLAGKYNLALALRLILGFIGAGVLAVFLYKFASTGEQKSLLGTVAIVAFALVLIAEVLGRYLFYATHVGMHF
jgi:anaerobic dimethyl sulfoxide reductase subunit C (anchor subunit)